MDQTSSKAADTRITADKGSAEALGYLTLVPSSGAGSSSPTMMHHYKRISHLILKRIRRRSKRPAGAGSGDEGEGIGEPPPSGGDGGRGGGSVGAARSRTSHGTGRACSAASSQTAPVTGPAVSASAPKPKLLDQLRQAIRTTK